jgi:MFS transporter, DHA1 family, multidrug resistance protein
MRTIKENHSGFSTYIALALIPISGFATDIFIPSLPSMASDFHISNSAAQLIIVFFMISYGIGQFFVGSLLDSFGRYKLGLTALVCFAFASLTIALTGNVEVIYLMRIMQGAAVALIVVGKRAYFVDVYSGDKLKNYVSLFSIIWATAPIVAPFIGGYLQSNFGWQSNFYFLGMAAIIFIILESHYGGESIREYQKFRIRSILDVYASTLKTPDYILGLLIIALSYSLLVVFGMASPFIIERVFKLSPIITGYCSLSSGIALISGGILSKSLLKEPLTKKISAAIVLLMASAALMIISPEFISNVYTFISFTLIIHFVSGFVFNNFFAYCLGRFSKNAGIVAGITGGALYILASLFSYGLVNIISINNQKSLGIANFILGVMITAFFILFTKSRNENFIRVGIRPVVES